MTLNPFALRSAARVFTSSGQRSDRSAGDRLRHRQKIREAIRNNITDIIAEESIIGKDRNRIIKVPIRGVREYRFVYGDNAPGVGQGGDGDPQPGQVVGQGKDGKGGQQAGDRPGVDYYETDVTLDELIDLMFEDLELPDLERKRLRQVEVERQFRQKGFRRKGIRVRLDKKCTARSRIGRIAIFRTTSPRWRSTRDGPPKTFTIVVEGPRCTT